jgi:hypothetical protein
MHRTSLTLCLPTVTLATVLPVRTTRSSIRAQTRSSMDTAPQSCHQLWQEKAEGKDHQGKLGQRASARLKQDAGMRAEFFNKISAPTVTKVFERRPTKGRGVLPAGVEAKSTEHNDPDRYWR